MAQFKFGGRTFLDNEWVEGDLVHGNEGDVYIGTINVVVDIESTDVDLHQVYPSTVKLVETPYTSSADYIKWLENKVCDLEWKLEKNSYSEEL